MAVSPLVHHEELALDIDAAFLAQLLHVGQDGEAAAPAAALGSGRATDAVPAERQTQVPCLAQGF
eukprot:3982181-Alexandrium_andersonii.AAC.1